MRELLIAVILIVLIGGLGFVMRVKRTRSRNTNFIDLSSYKRRKKAMQQVVPADASQKCSFCKKTNKRLTFYTDDHGVVSGVCPDCKPIATRRDLTPL